MPRQDWRLVDFMPGGLEAVFDESSVAYTVVHCADLEERANLITQQLVALLALNKGLLVLGRPASTSLHHAVEVALEEGLVTERQAKYLRGLNRRANEAKHFPFPDKEDDDAGDGSNDQATGSGGGTPASGGSGGTSRG